MTVAQRGTSSTSSGYQTVDRHKISFGGLDESPTMSQHVLTSSDTGPYEEGFRYSFQIQNGNQTSGLGSSDEIEYTYRPEAQDIANSGWNYISTSSFVTLQFWVKSSVAQNFFGYLRTLDGTGQRFAFETGSLTANTWKKVTVKVPGNSNLQFDNNDNDHLSMRIVTPANNTTARTYTIHFGSEGAQAQFFVSTLSSSGGSTYPMTFTITEIAA